MMVRELIGGGWFLASRSEGHTRKRAKFDSFQQLPVRRLLLESNDSKIPQGRNRHAARFRSLVLRSWRSWMEHTIAKSQTLQSETVGRRCWLSELTKAYCKRCCLLKSKEETIEERRRI